MLAHLNKIYVYSVFDAICKQICIDYTRNIALVRARNDNNIDELAMRFNRNEIQLQLCK